MTMTVIGLLRMLIRNGRLERGINDPEGNHKMAARCLGLSIFVLGFGGRNFDLCE